MASSIVAVAGGTGNLGRTIVEAIVRDAKVKVNILSRKVDAEKEKEIGAPILAVDYNNVDALVKVLEENKIDTVLATLSGSVPTSNELNLIQAAERSSTTRRYVPSAWGLPYPEDIADKFAIAAQKVALRKALAKTTLEHTTWYPGYFSDYFVYPGVPSHMAITHIIADVPNNFAGIPGSGDVPSVFTHTEDVAKFASASLSLSKWEPETWLIGDKLTLNQLVDDAEEVKGVKFERHYDAVEKLQTGEITELPSHVEAYKSSPKKQLQQQNAALGLLFERGTFNFNPEKTIQDYFPNIHARTMKELLIEAYKK